VVDDTECSTTAASLIGSVTQTDWLGPKVGGCPALVQWQCHDDSIINIVLAVSIIIVCVLLLFVLICC